MKRGEQLLWRFSAILLLVLLVLPITSLAAAPEPENIVEYDIVVTLDQDCSRLDGQERVVWTNPGSTPVTEMFLHLYPNAFRPGSTFLTESKGSRHGERIAQSNYGQMELSKVQSGGRGLNCQFVQPDDGNEQDLTLVCISLPHAVGPGESIRLDIDFSVQLPEVFTRMGKYGEFVMAGQWFPKLAAYETAGTRGRSQDGWNAHQYHANTEFYANFGYFKVTINVPKTHTVAATGKMVASPLVKGGQRQYVFEAHGVHDFAWAADSTFVERQILFERPTQPEMRIQLYLQPEHEYLVARYFEAAEATMARLSSWFTPYPYPTLTIVCPRAGASGAGGMEYPTLVTGWDASIHNLDTIRTVLVHEIVHQYFYGLVASNEFEEAWLDEGFTSYIEDKIMADAFEHRLAPAVEAASVFVPEPLVLDGWKYSSAYAYQSNVYLRGKLVLHEIERLIGWPEMQAALREYVRRFMYSHPTTADWQATLEDVTGRNWESFFDAYVYSDLMQDYSIAGVITQATATGWSSSVELAGPVEERKLHLKVIFDDGSTCDLTWNPAAGNQISFEHNNPLRSLELDPVPYKVILDHVRVNNSYQVRASNWLATWLSHLLQLFSQLLGW